MHGRGSASTDTVGSWVMGGEDGQDRAHLRHDSDHGILGPDGRDEPAVHDELVKQSSEIETSCLAACSVRIGFASCVGMAGSVVTDHEGPRSRRRPRVSPLHPCAPSILLRGRAAVSAHLRRSRGRSSAPLQRQANSAVRICRISHLILLADFGLLMLAPCRDEIGSVGGQQWRHRR